LFQEKFVTRRTLEDSADLQKSTDDFLETVKPLIEQLDLKIFTIQIKVVSNWNFILEDHCLTRKKRK